MAGQGRWDLRSPSPACTVINRTSYKREGGNKHTLLWSCNFTRCSDVSLDQVCNHSIKVVFIGTGCCLCSFVWVERKEMALQHRKSVFWAKKNVLFGTVYSMLKWAQHIYKLYIFFSSLFDYQSNKSAQESTNNNLVNKWLTKQCWDYNINLIKIKAVFLWFYAPVNYWQGIIPFHNVKWFIITIMVLTNGNGYFALSDMLFS